MTHWRSRSRSGLSVLDYSLAPAGLRREGDEIVLSYYVRDLRPKVSSAFRFTVLLRRSLRLSVLAILLVAGLTYAILTMLGELSIAHGYANSNLVTRIELFRRAAKLFPLERRFRIASANQLANFALQAEKNDTLLEIAASEIKYRLTTDPTQADLLAMLVQIELTLNHDAEAQLYYDQFKRVAKKSPLLDLVKHSHE